MHSAQALLDRLWDDYSAITPQADRIHRLLTQQGERVVNDHIALRTFDHPSVNIDRMAAPFVASGYREAGRYSFPEKKLSARHYEHVDDNLPRVFISELRIDDCSASLRETIVKLIARADQANLAAAMLPTLGRPWPISHAEYLSLAAESEYAGWVSAFGFRANHFTVLVNALRTLPSLQALNAFLESQGFELNSAGGKIKGTPAEHLEQSSTLADKVDVSFSDGVHRIPGCYYEFARRYPMPDGRLFGGFIARSANRIFESTDRR